MSQAIVSKKWPQPSSVAEPEVYAKESSLFLRYETKDDQIVIIKFPLVSVFQFGSPNDEALGGHPLSQKGLEFYSVHQIQDSEWIQKLEKQNSVHPRHDKKEFVKDKVHYVFTFQDLTLECLITEGEFWKPEIELFSSLDDANTSWGEKVRV